MTGSLPNRVLLIGGTSEIGLEILRRLAAETPITPYLLGRDEERLKAGLAELERAGSRPGMTGLLEAEDVVTHDQVISDAFARAGGFDLVVLAVGMLGAQDGLDADHMRALEIMRVNFLDSGSLMLASLRALRDHGGGTFVLLSSVAAERPRAANAIYGAAKAGLDALAQGLADASTGYGVRVLVIRPGFVRTRMTAGLRPTPFATTASAVAAATVNALGRSDHTVWAPGVLRFVFAVLRHLPRPIYRRLPL